MSWTDLLSDDPQTMAGGIQAIIGYDFESSLKVRARQGVEYYNGRHDILNNRILYVTKDGFLSEDKFASNVKIAHTFLTELIDQKVQYLLSNPIEFDCGDDEGYQTALGSYYDEDFQIFLQEMLEGASQKSVEYCYARTTADDTLVFQVADSLKIVPIYDDGNNLKRILRYYNKGLYKDSWSTELFGIHNFEDGQPAMLTFAEIWDDEKVWFFVAQQDQAFKFDTSISPNPRPHILAQQTELDDDGNEVTELLERSLGTLPFYRLQNNAGERTDLEPVKALIDDYDLMNCFMSNNLQDFSEAIYVVSGFTGDIGELKMAVKNRKIVGLPENGSVDVKTVSIPTAGREAKMKLDMQNIYKFGMGFDSAQVGDGNITNVVIKSRYTLLNMKVNKAETRLKAMMKWINQLVTADINRKRGTTYDPQTVKFTFNPEILNDELDNANSDNLEAQARLTTVNAILAAAPKIDNDSVIQLICDQFDLSFDEVQDALTRQEYDNIASGTDPTLTSGNLTDSVSLSDSASESVV